MVIEKCQCFFYFFPFLIGYDVSRFAWIFVDVFHPILPPIFLIPMLFRFFRYSRYFRVKQVHDFINGHIAIFGSIMQKAYYFFFPIESCIGNFQKVRFKIIVGAFVYLAFVQLLSHQAGGIYDFCHISHIIFQSVYSRFSLISVVGRNIIIILTHEHLWL